MARAGLAVACSILTASFSSQALAQARQADAGLLAASRAAEPAVIKTL